MDHDRRHYLSLRVQKFPQVLDTFTVGNLICALFEAKSGDIGRWQWIGDWYLEAVQREIDSLIAAEDTFWHCAISFTIVRASSCTHVFEVDANSNYVPAVAFDE